MLTPTIHSRFHLENTLSKMTTNLRNYGLVALAALALTSAASALPIIPTSGVLNVTRWEGNETGQPQIDAVIAPIIGASTEKYKQNVGGAESGSLAGSYTTTFANTPGDPSDATIVYNGGPILGNTRYMLVKDGNQTPAWYLFNLTALGWNGTETLFLTGFWPNQGAISHISLYGGPDGGDTPGVPDSGSTIALLGLGLSLLAIVRRKLA
jgi:hypothetical protein